jgi:hypothetical protein
MAQCGEGAALCVGRSLDPPSPCLLLVSWELPRLLTRI